VKMDSPTPSVPILVRKGEGEGGGEERSPPVLFFFFGCLL